MRNDLGALSLLKGTCRHPRAWRRAAALFGALGIGALVWSWGLNEGEWGALGVICLVGLAFALYEMRLALRDGARRAISDPFVVLIGSFALYFLIGPLLLVFGPEEQASELLRWFPTSSASAVRVTGMNLVGLSILLSVAGLLPGKMVESAVAPIDRVVDRIHPKTAFWLFALIGGYSAVTVFVLDMSGTDEVVSGTVRTLSQVILIAILIGAMYRGRGRRTLHILSLLAATAVSLLGLMSFNKSAVLQPWMVYLFGFYLGRPTAKWIGLIVILLVAALIALTRPIGDARSMLGNSVIDLRSRAAILESALTPRSDSELSDMGGTAWIRLCYVVPQVAAVSFYEAGLGGDDAELLAWVLVPRVLFPNKPIITRSGTDFNFKITGSDTSSTGMGIFISGYYNWGWLGLIAVSTAAGLILAIFAAVARGVVACGSALLLPVAMVGAYMAFRIDGHFVADYWGTFAMVMVPFLIIGFSLSPRSPLVSGQA